MMNEKLAELAAAAGFDMSQYEPEQDLDGLPMGFLEDYGNQIIRACANIAEREQKFNWSSPIQVKIDQCILCNFGL